MSGQKRIFLLQEGNVVEGGGIKYFWYFPLLIPSPRGALIYERFIKLAFNKQGRDSYLNELVYAKLMWQIMLKVIVQ